MNLVEKLEDRYLFTPVKDYLNNAGELGTKEVAIPFNGQKLYLRASFQSNRKLFFLNCHGNRRNISLLAHAYQIYNNLNANYVLFDYPGYGLSEGEPSEANCYASTECVLDWIKKNYNLLPEDIIIHGLSMGGAVAIEMLTRYKFKAGIVDITFTNTKEMAQHLFPLNPLNFLIKPRFDSSAKIHQIPTPMLFIAAEKDKRVPPSMTKKLFDLKNGPKQFAIMPAATHADHATLNMDLYLSAVHKFLDSYIPSDIENYR